MRLYQHLLNLYVLFQFFYFCKTNTGQELPVQTKFSSIFWIHLRVHNNNCYDSNAKCAYYNTNCPVQENHFDLELDRRDTQPAEAKV